MLRSARQCWKVGYQEPKLFRRNQVGRGVFGALELCSTEGKPNVKAVGGRRKRFSRAFRIQDRPL